MGKHEGWSVMKSRKTSSLILFLISLIFSAGLHAQTVEQEEKLEDRVLVEHLNNDYKKYFEMIIGDRVTSFSTSKNGQLEKIEFHFGGDKIEFKIERWPLVGSLRSISFYSISEGPKRVSKKAELEAAFLILHNSYLRELHPCRTSPIVNLY